MQGPINSYYVLEVGEAQYLAEPHPAARVPWAPDPANFEQYCLATVIHHNGTYFGRDELREIRQRYGQADDVWDEAFLQVILLLAPQPDVELSPNLGPDHTVIVLERAAYPLPPGPFVIANATGRVFPVYKLYDDTQMAFVGGVTRSHESDSYRWVKSSNRIPIPSRLSYEVDSKTKPLNGLRFAVKDVIDVAGLETGNGSLCWAKTYGASKMTAPFITRLVEAGAVLVGKLRCAQFCDGQDPMERFEEVTPYNPRGDGFQKPSSSSSGSAVACASYPWIDFTIGTDTGGSVRAPAGVCGVFGLRPSVGSVESRGLVLSELMDTVGLFARSSAMMDAISRCIVERTDTSIPAGSYEKTRFKLLVATESPSEPRENLRFFPVEGSPSPVPNLDALQQFEHTIAAVEDCLGIKRENICLYDLWKQTHPEGTPERLENATSAIYTRIVYRNLRQNILSPFTEAYQARNSGESPFIEPLLQARVDYAGHITSADYDAAVDSFHMFSKWLQETILPAHTQGDTTTTAAIVVPILVFPQTWGLAQYRDEATDYEGGRKLFWDGFSVYSISYCSGCPEVSVPVGQVEFLSKVTKTKAHIPTALSIASPVGTDLVLLHLLQRLEAAGILKAVGCGRTLYT